MAHEIGALLRLAGPIIVGQLGAVAMNTTDTLMVAPLGPGSLAAAGLAGGVLTAVLVAFSGMLMGMTPLVSQAHGAGDPGQARRVLVQGVWMALVLSLPVTAVALAGPRAAALLGQSPEVTRLMGRFLLALAPGILPLMLFSAIRQYLDGLGRTQVAMWTLFAGVAVNALGNQALIHGVAGWLAPLGVAGSGLSTSIVRWCICGALATYVALHPELTPFGRTRLGPRGDTIRRVAGIGAPIGLQIGAEVSTFALGAVMMGWLGPVQLAAHSVAVSIASATFMVAVGASAAGTIRVGHHVGAGRVRAVHRAAVATYAVSLGFMSCCALAFLLLPRFLIGLYTKDAGVVAFGTDLLFVAAVFQVFDGGQVTGLSVLRGAADTRVPMLVTLLAYWVIGIPTAYLLGFHTPLRHVGIWTGLTVSLAVVAVLLAWRVRIVLWQRPLRAAVSRRGRREAEAAVEAQESLPAMGATVAGD